MPDRFSGFAPEALKFLRALKRNNNRDWFQPRKGQFDDLLRKPMMQLIERLNTNFAAFAPDYVTEPGKSLFRIYRDTRFSKDKTPYKTHISALFGHRLLPRNYAACFYLELSAEGAGVGGGIYRPPNEVLKILRTHIAEHTAEYNRIIRAIEAKKIAGAFEGHRMSRVPRGFLPDDAAAELLKCRSLFFYTDLPGDLALIPDFQKEIAARFKVITPFVQLIDRAFVGRKREARMEMES